MKLCVIIPVYKDDAELKKLLDKLNICVGIDEIIISDGQDNNDIIISEKKYKNIKYKLIKCKKGRANQMNIASKYAKSDVLWFIHADSNFDINIPIKIKKTIENGYLCGGLKLKFNPNTILLKIIAFLSNIRAKIFKICFGDQSIFITKELFEHINGFKNIPIMEDLQLFLDIKKYKKEIKYFKQINETITTSSRRFLNNGTLKTILVMHKMKYLYFKGKSPKELNEIYEGMKNR